MQFEFSIMIFSYNWLQSFFEKRLPNPQKLGELLTLHSFEVQKIEKRGNDWVFDIDVTPNRADCFSHLGMAKECGAILNSKLKSQKSKPQPKTKNLDIKNFITIEVKSKTDCPRYTAKVILGVKVKPSPKWIQERLISCGLQPIDNIVDATNYVMLEVGQPLHAFDLDKINPKFEILNPKQIKNPKLKIQKKKIIIRRAKKGEKIEALDDKTYILNENILVIADKESPIAIAGIKGGKKAQISEETKNILIESANFNPVLIRKGQRELKLKTDASFRFEHGLDPNMTEMALLRVTSLIQEIAGGKVLAGEVDYYPQKVKPWTVKLNIKKLQKVLGIEIPPNKVLEILKRLGLEIKKRKKDIIVVGIPTIRKDLQIEEDLIEEVGRIYGYEHITVNPPKTLLKLPEKEDALVWASKVRRILKELGFVEVYNYSFISEKDKQKLDLVKLIELENPISDEFKYLRPSLLINLIKNIQENQKNFKQFKLFEIGKIFYQQKEKLFEKKMISGVIFGEKDGFYLIKGIIDSLLEQLGVSDVFYDEYQPTPEDSLCSFWHIRKSAEIKVSNKEIGFLGEISKKVTSLYDIHSEIYAFDIDFDKLSKLASEEQEYLPISKYPAAVRDIAILTPLNTKVADVMNAIYGAGGKLLKDVDLFDIYMGEEIPDGKKNLAFHLIFQSDQKTLSSEEVDKLFTKIIQALEENPEWEVRK